MTIEAVPSAAAPSSAVGVGVGVGVFKTGTDERLIPNRAASEKSSPRVRALHALLPLLLLLPSASGFASTPSVGPAAAFGPSPRTPPSCVQGRGVVSRGNALGSNAGGDDDGGGSSRPPPTYPVSRRALIQAARSVDSSSSSGGGGAGTYSPVGWSNRAGSVLTPAAVPGLYEASRPFYWNRIDVGCKMTVAVLTATDAKTGKPELFVHSPVSLDDRLVEALDRLGTVKHVVSPNYEHVKYAGQWAERYPDAHMWGCPGLAEREPDVRWTGEIPYGARPPGYPCVPGEADPPPSKPRGPDGEEMWDWNEVQPLHFDTEVNPFTGRAFFNEVVFYHAPSKSLICTDTYWNYPSPDGVTNANYDGVEGKEEDFGVWELAPEVGKIPLGSRLWKVGMDKLFRPFYMNLMVRSDSQDRFKNLAAYVSGYGWDVQTVIPAHGDTIRGKTLCRNVLREHFGLEGGP